MSLKRVVLIAALALLVMPAAALADGITFGYTGTVINGVTTVGHLSLVQPNSGGAVLGSVATNVGLGNTRVTYVSRFSGNSIPTPGLPIPNNLPPQIAPTFGSLLFDNNPFNFGSVIFTTGTANAFTTGSSASVTYSAGGSIVITGNGNLAGTGNPLFSGSFVGPTTLTLVGAPPNPACTSCNFWYNISGLVSGNVDPGLMALLNMPSGGLQSGQGIFFSFTAGFVGPTDTVGNVEAGATSIVVPEPGTLALFGTGLIGIAGFIRRRFKA